MFTNNSISGAKAYFKQKLTPHYSSREIDIFFEWTCADLFKLSKSDFLLGDFRFKEAELLQIKAVADQLLQDIPIQYILGKAHFYGLELKVDERVLIPRPETEELVDIIVKNHSKGSLLDIGTGSGAIPIAIKKQHAEMELSAMDISTSALTLAKENAHLNEVDIEFYQGDILEADLGRSFDVIVSNPPYVLMSDKKEMANNVLRYEPEQALFVADERPLLFYERITDLAARHLFSGGYLYFEIHERFGNEMIELVKDFDFINIQVIQDAQGKDRILRAQKKP